MAAAKYFKFLIPCFLMILGNCAFVNMTLFQPVTPLKEHVIEGKGDPKILLVDISGVISEQEKGGSLSLEKSRP